MKGWGMLWISLSGALVFSIACRDNQKEPAFLWKDLNVTVTAYNSVDWQTSGNPDLTAWGDTLRPGVNWVAVSRDLIPLGLDHNTQVKIEGIEGIYLVKDKMNQRFSRHIDIYLGSDIDSARNWGRQKRRISYRIPKEMATDKIEADRADVQ